jgi:hypothetical protein
VAAQPRTGIEGHESERLGAGRGDHFPDVDPHPVEDDLELVDEGDVHRAEDVLQELGRLRDLGAGDRHDPVHRRAVERDRRVQRRLIDAPHHLGDVLGAEVLVAGVLALGREGEKVVDAALEAAGVETGQELLARGAGVGRRLEDDELSLAQVRGDRLRTDADVLEVGLAMDAERRGDADQDGIAFGQAGMVRRGFGAAAAEGAGDALRTDVADVRLAAPERVDLLLVDVEADDPEPLFREEQDQRQADIAEADDPDGGVAVLDGVDEWLSVRHG